MRPGQSWRWAHAVGERTNRLLVADVRAKVMQVRQLLRQPGDYFFTPMTPTPLPWRVNAAGFKDVDQRVLNMVYPHNTERVVKKGKSFLQLTAAACKTGKKILALTVVLPTVLRGYVHALRRGIRLMVLGLRLIDGQVHSYNECRRLGVEPGSRCIDKRQIEHINRLIVQGIARIEGSVPPSTLPQYLHVIGTWYMCVW